MLKSTALKGLIALAGLFFGVRAFAQFEVAPDHFDSAASQNTLKKKAKAAPTATAHPVTDASAVARAAAPRDRQNSTHSASRTAHGLQSYKSTQRRFNRSQVIARRKRPGREQILTVSQ